MPFLVDGASRTLLTGEMSCESVTTPYLFNAGSGLKVPGGQTPDTLALASAPQTWSGKIFKQPVITSGSFTSPTIAGAILSGVTGTFSGTFASAILTQPVITSAKMTYPIVTQGGSWTSGTLTLPTVTTGTFTSPTIAQGTASFLALRSCTIQTCNVTSPVILLTECSASGGVWNSVVRGGTPLPIHIYTEQAGPFGSGVGYYGYWQSYSLNMLSGNIFRMFIGAAGTLTVANIATGMMYIVIPVQANNSHCAVSWMTGFKCAGVSAITATTGAVDMFTILYDGANHLAIDIQRNVA